MTPEKKTRCLNKRGMIMGVVGKRVVVTLPETNAENIENGRNPKRKQSSSNHPFSGAKMFVSGSVASIVCYKTTQKHLVLESRKIKLPEQK